jgi:hypothetical protein
VIFCLAKAANRKKTGVFAKIIPMNFPNGLPYKKFNNELYSMPQILTPYGAVSYIIYIYLPRFFLQDLEKRLLTVIHELYHISPEFDGTIRMFGGRPHGNSREKFNENLKPIIEKYLQVADMKILEILGTDYRDLLNRHTITGRTLALPKAIRIKE